MSKKIKTNAMRFLENRNIPFTSHEYPHDKDPVDGVRVAAAIGKDPATVYKTLVTEDSKHDYYVFEIPVDQELDLKKAAAAAGVKSLSMLRVADIQKVTGYVRGGCSPLAMKKQYPTFFHDDCLRLPTMIVSAGKIGHQIEADPNALIAATQGITANLVKT